jgi:hypothetical protein
MAMFGEEKSNGRPQASSEQVLDLEDKTSPYQGYPMLIGNLTRNDFAARFRERFKSLPKTLQVRVVYFV